MQETLAKVFVRHDVTPRAKLLAMALASHYPKVHPPVHRLMLLTGIRSTRNCVTKRLYET